jgi:hypothetical protein
MSDLYKKISELLTARGLAIWICDDGCWENKSGKILCSESFNLDENKLLISVLESKVGLQCSLIKIWQKKF